MNLMEIMSRLDLLNKKTDLGAPAPQSDNQEDTPQKHTDAKKAVHPWRRVIVVFVLGVFVLVGIVGYKAYSVGNNISSPEEELTFFEQIATLIRPPDKPLNGEDEGRINILLLGFGGSGHEGAYLTDTMMVASVNPITNEVAMLSIPRDLFVDIPGIGYRKINSAFALGQSDENPEGAEELTQATVQNVLGIPIHYYAWIDFSGFEEIIDDIGGIDVPVENAFVDYSYPTNDYGYQTIRFEEGMQSMDGETALQFVRSRKGTNGEGSDFARSKRQQLVLLAVKDKLTGFGTLANPSKVSAVLDDLSGHMKTNFQIWEILKLAGMFENINSNTLYTRVLDNSPNGLLVSGYTQDGAYILRPKLGWEDFSAIQYLAENIFDIEAINAEEATIAVFNGTKEEGLAKNTADSLESQNYSVTQIGTASAYVQTTIYDLSLGSTPLTLKAIEEEFDAHVRTSVPESVLELIEDDQVDIIIILGDDFLPTDITGGPVA